MRSKKWRGNGVKKKSRKKQNFSIRKYGHEKQQKKTPGRRPTPKEIFQTGVIFPR